MRTRALIAVAWVGVAVLASAGLAGCGTGSDDHHSSPASVSVDDPQDSAGRHASGDAGDNAGSDGDQKTQKKPRIAVDPTTIKITCAGEECAKKVTIRSTGSAALKVSSIDLVDAADGFLLTTRCDHKTLDPGESCATQIEWDGPLPPEPQSARIRVASDATSDETDVKVTLAPDTHKDPAARLVVSPQDVTLPCPGDDCAQPVTIRNDGTAPATIGVITFQNESDPNFTFGHGCVNQHLVPGEECTFRVGWYGPSDDQSNVYTATLRIGTDGDPAYVGVTRLPTGPIVGGS